MVFLLIQRSTGNMMAALFQVCSCVVSYVCGKKHKGHCAACLGFLKGGAHCTVCSNATLRIKPNTLY